MPVVTQRWRSRREYYRPAGEPIRTADYHVEPIPETCAKDYVLAHHYAGTYPAARFRYGLFRHDDLVGVAVCSHPTNDRVLTTTFPALATREAVELGRLILHDSVAANGESFMLARVFEYLRAEGVVGLVAFSDPVPRRTAEGLLVKRGHLGVVYQATNAQFCGRATPRTLQLLPNGMVLSPRTVQKIRAAEQGWTYAVEQLVEAGAHPPRCLGSHADRDELRTWLPRALAVTRPLRHPGNYRYAWGLVRSIRPAGPPQPYPKALTLPASRLHTTR